MPDPSDSKKRGVRCGQCEQIWYATPRAGKTLLAWSGICPTCRAVPSEVILPKGTIALFNKPIPVVPASGGNPYYKIALRCRSCYPENGEEKYINRSTVRKYMADPVKNYWDELCSECVIKRGPTTRLTTDKVAPSGTVTQFGRENAAGEVPIVYKLCGHERWTPKANAISNYIITLPGLSA